MKRAVLGALLCAFVAAPAIADITVYLREVGTTPGTALTLTSSGYNGGAYVGIYNLNLKNPSGYTGPVGDVESFCIDLWDFSNSGYTLYKVVSLDKAPDPGAGNMGAVRAGYLAQLLNTYWVPTMSDLDKTALQAAVWEVVDEGHGGAVPAPTGFAVNAGSFQVSAYGGNTVTANAVIATANDMLKSITTGASFGGYLAVSSPPDILGAAQYQDYVVKVPVPAALLIGLLGLGTAGFKLRKQV